VRLLLWESLHFFDAHGMPCSYLRNNSLTGGLPPAWGNPDALPSLRFLYLANNPLGGEQHAKNGPLAK
jgi:hypothetical protein